MPTIKNEMYVSGNSMVGRNYKGIGSPFFDNSNIYLPQNREEMLGLAEYFYMYNSILRGTINKLAAYPLTELQFDSIANEKLKDKWQDILNEHIDVRSICKQSGINTFTYGEAFIIPHEPKRREYKCTGCGYITNSVSKIKRPEWKVKRKGKDEKPEHTFSGECPHCNKKKRLKITDKSMKGAEHIRFINVHPKYFAVKQNLYTGDSVYYMKIDKELQKSIKKFDPDYFDSTPVLFIEATFDKKNIKINKHNIYHLKNTGLTSTVMPEHGESAAMATFKDLFFSQMLKHTQEIIAKDRAVGYRGVSPSDQASMMSDLSSTKAHVIKEIKEWRSDPNHIAWFPFPMQFSNFSGEARNLFLANEIKSANDFAIVGLEVPQNFVYGNVGSYSGGSVDLRMLENRFLSYITQLNKMLREFIIPKCAAFYDIPAKEGAEGIRFQKFKMADDIQHKQMLANLAMNNKLSIKTLLDNVDAKLDYDDEIKQIALELKQMAEAQGDAGMINAEAQAKVQTKAMIMQAEAQQKMQMGLPENSGMFDGTQFSRIPLVEGAVDRFKSMIEQNGSVIVPQVLMWEQQFPNIMNRLYEKYPAISEMMTQAKMSMQGGGGMPQEEQAQQGGGQTSSEPQQQGQPVEPPMPEQRPSNAAGGGPM